MIIPAWLQGIIPRIFEETAKRIGIQYEIVTVKTRQEYQDLLSSGTIDACLDEIYAPSEANDRGFRLTDPYLSTSIAQIVKNDFSGKVDKIAILKNINLKLSQEKELCKGLEAVEYDSTEECINAVKNGDVDTTYVYAYAAQIALNNDPANVIRMNIMMDYGNEFSIGVAKDRDYHLLTILNKGINSIEKELIQNIISDETDYLVDEVSVTTYLRSKPWILAIIAVFIVLVIAGVVFLLVRIRYVNNMKLEEENKNKLLQEKAEQEAEFVQAMTYVCRTNELVRNTNLIDRTYMDYYLEDGQLKTKTAPYVGFDLGNHNLIFHPDDYEQVVKRFDERKVQYLSQHGGGEEYFECRSKNEKGEYQWYGYTMQAVPVDAVHPCNYIVYKKNINEAKQEELKARQNLEDALKMAQNASKAKGQFMSRMSHEIRTPLNAVLGYMTMAKQAEGEPDKVKHCIDNSEIAAKHLLNIINDVLDISAIESGKIKIAHDSFDLKEVLHSLETVFSNQADTKNIHFQLDMSDIIQNWVVGDALRLNQVLMNLLSNAMKFTEENGHVQLQARQLKHSDHKSLYEFQVSDDGIGMSEEFQTRLYGTFEQESAKTAVKYGGSGLGLSISRNLIAMMNGDISVKSKEGEGTTFTVVLELETAEQENQKAESEIQLGKHRILIVEQDEEAIAILKKILKGYGMKAEFVDTPEAAIKKIEVRKGSDYMYHLCLVDQEISEHQENERAIDEMNHMIHVEKISRPVSQSVIYNLLVKHFGQSQQSAESAHTQIDLKGMRVLLAEDNDMNMEIATDILTKAGLIVTGVRDGKEALDTFEASEEGTFQAILMDIQMPVMDGYEATRRIRKSSHPQSHRIPIIAMTANAFTEDVSAAFAAGMNDHISKPINFEKLYQSLQKIL